MNGASTFLREVQVRNEFAHLAFQWLVPQPIFIEEHKAPRNDPEAQTQGAISWETIRLGHGITPDPRHESWQWFTSKRRPQVSAESRANHAGWPMRWGPRVLRRVVRGLSEDPYSFDYIQEWVDWFAAHTFSVNSAWPETPPGFRRDWESLWRRISGAEERPRLTKLNRGWSPSAITARARREIREANRYILNLVADLELERLGKAGMTAPAIPTGGGHFRRYRRFRLKLSSAEEVGLTLFDLTQNRQLVELPVLLSRKAARQALRALETEITQSLPKVHELLGTQRAWESYLAVEPFREGGTADLGKAMGQFFRSRVRAHHLSGSGVSSGGIARWLDNGTLRPLSSHATKAEADERSSIEQAVSQAATDDRQRSRQIEDWVRFLDVLAAATYPTFDTKQLSQKTPHRGTLGGERTHRKPKEA
ncbi:MAG: hypothetical protein JNL10_04000 [Verrucomicrobiales bacterium]|nr:hypothetical protein [Verrucomicrobiales bacterium]